MLRLALCVAHGALCAKRRSAPADASGGRGGAYDALRSVEDHDGDSHGAAAASGKPPPGPGTGSGGAPGGSVHIRDHAGLPLPSVPAGHGEDAVTAVADLSLTVRRGECLALLGHNGAGKSSTISVMTGLLQPDGGLVEVCGHDVTSSEGMGALARHIGVCPQYEALWPQLTAVETLRLFAAIKGVPPSELDAEVARVLREVRLTSVAGKQVGTFSGGMRRRVSIAVAVLGSPPVLVLDEPTASMDPSTRMSSWRIVERLKRAGAAVILTIAGGANQGVVQAAAEAGAKVIWFDVNGYGVQPGTVVGSAVVRQDKAAYEQTRRYLDGSLPFGASELVGVAEGYVDFIEDDPAYIAAVSEPVRRKQAALVQRLRTGSLRLDE
jgi:ABC-type Na+ transport system ATPase subunit NatA